MMREFLKIALPSLISFCGVVFVAVYNSRGAKQKTLQESVAKMVVDVNDLKKDMKETHEYISEIITVLTTAFNEHKDRGEFNGQTTNSVRHMQQVLTDNALNK